MAATNVDWPHHMIDGKSAFLLLTESHILKMYYQQDFGPWSEVTTSLWDSGTSEDVLTHAAFSDENKFLHLVAYSSRGGLRVYKVSIEWSSTQSKDPSRPFQIVQAQLKVEYLYGLQTVITQPTPDVSLDIQQALYRSRLTSLSILAPSPFLEVRHPQIQAVFTYASDMYSPQNPPTSCSALVRWDITTEEPELLDVFKTFKSGNAKLAPETVTILKRLPDLTMPKIMLQASTVLSEPYFAVALSDGSIDFYNRSDLQIITSDNDDTKASSYAQSGFSYFNTEKFSDVALTPDASVAAILTNDGRIMLKIMDYMPGWDSNDTPDYRTQAALCTIARSIATLTGLVISADEPLALLPPHLPKPHRSFLIKQIYRMLQRPYDFTLEENRKMSGRILRDPALAKTLSTHLFISYGPSYTLDLPGKVIWISLNLRLIASSIAATVTPKDQPKADAVVALGPSVKWCIDLCVHILDDFAEAMKTPVTSPPTKPASITVLILLASTPRALLRMTLELLKLYFPKMAQCSPTTIQQRVALQELSAYSRTLPIKLPHLESVMAEVDSGVRQAYNSAKLASAARVEHEVRMLVDGEVPDVLQPVVEHVFSQKIAGKVVDGIDRGALWAWDTSSLGLKEGRRREGRWDVVRKMPVREGTKVRVCKRCGSLMEDVWLAQERQGLPTWLQNAQRSCVCLGYWMVEG
ncbi:Mediator complex subunit 16-like protein [Elsinoe fawcettii]|nr:Mediator complex subunit 16-like protein [Elsinoe fawcettii]